MPDKALRVLIADKQHAQRVCIEKMLNYIGYYCVASVGSYDDLVALTTPPIRAFDLLIVNSQFSAYQNIDIGSFCKFNDQVYHSMVYGGDRVWLPKTSRYQPVHASLIQAPDFRAMRDFMGVIDRSALVSPA